MHDNNPFQNIKDHHRQNLNEVGDTFKGKLKLAGYAARRGLQLVGLQRKESKMQKEKQRLMNLIRSGNAPPLSYLNNFTDTEYALQNKGDRMARGIISALGSIRGRPIPEEAVKETNMNLKEYFKNRLLNKLFEEEQNSDVMYVDIKSKSGSTITGGFNTAGMDKTDISTQQGLNAVKNKAKSGNMAAASKIYKFTREMDRVRQDNATKLAIDPSGL